MNALIKPHHAGLFSLLNNVITCMALYDRVSVDWSGSLYGEGNLWNQLFEPFPAFELPFETVESYPDQWLTYRNAGALYLSGNDWRESCNRSWSNIQVRQHIIDSVRTFAGVMLVRSGCTMAVQVRSTPQGGEQVNGQSQPLDLYARAIEAEMRVRRGAVYAVCSDEESLQWLRDRFPVVSYPDINRSPTRATDHHLETKQTFRDARNCLQEVMAMSLCDALIHPVSNMATAALYMNPSLKSIYIQ